MESSLWNKLPHDLEILVLLRLPILDLRSLSFTCKYFQSLLSDPSFAIHYGRHCHTQTVFVASIRLQNPIQKTVLSSLTWQQGRNPVFLWQIPLFDYLHGSGWWLSGYGYGLVCFRGPLGHLMNDKKLLVFNPVFPHESKILTLPAESAAARERLDVAIAFDRKNGVCKLIFWDKLPDDRVVTFVYTFKEGVWKTIKGCNGSGKSFAIWGRPQLVKESFLCWLCTDLISSLKMVLVFDVEEEMWKDPIPLGNRYFFSLIQYEKQPCLVSRTYQKEKILEIWKFDLEERVLRLLEFIPPPIPRETEYLGGLQLYKIDEWSRGFFRLDEWNIKEKRYYTWVYDMSHHSWQYLGHHNSLDYVRFEGSLFRLAVS